jgi:hypothetical protein
VYPTVEPLQFAARLGFLDPDVHSGDKSLADTETTHGEVGLNAAIPRSGVRFQLGYAVFVPALSGLRRRHEVTFSTQIAF